MTIYYKCDTLSCKYINYLVYYAHDDIPDNPTCNECNNQYKQQIDIDEYNNKRMEDNQ